MMIVFPPLGLYALVSLAVQPGFSFDQVLIMIGFETGSLMQIYLASNSARVDLPLAGVPRTWEGLGVRMFSEKTAQELHQD